MDLPLGATMLLIQYEQEAAYYGNEYDYVYDLVVYCGKIGSDCIEVWGEDGVDYNVEYYGLNEEDEEYDSGYYYVGQLHQQSNENGGNGANYVQKLGNCVFNAEY
ncbi:MAG: hypothetical protein EZS28_004318 [Streblomastix strix]|uniref:Uncharacterized protein n=1 Tax=Streblomastix strix TaxID=222440 RepID=A0A5J4WZ84_9EUKA|nr:MAG: hypothetical protein EZS28_004318 [Streblomastix strix]